MVNHEEKRRLNPLKMHIAQFALCAIYMIALGLWVFHYATCPFPDTRFDLWCAGALVICLVLVLTLITKMDLKADCDRWLVQRFHDGPDGNPWLVYLLLISGIGHLLCFYIWFELDASTMLATTIGLVLFGIPYIFGADRRNSYVATVITAWLGCAAFVLYPAHTIAGCFFVVAAAVIALVTLGEVKARPGDAPQLPRRYCVLLSVMTLFLPLLVGALVYLLKYEGAADYLRYVIDHIAVVENATPWWVWLVMIVLTVALLIAAKWRWTVSGGPIGYAAVSFLLLPMWTAVIADGFNLSILTLPEFGLPLMGHNPVITMIQMALLVGMFPHTLLRPSSIRDDWMIAMYGEDCEICDLEEEYLWMDL